MPSSFDDSAASPSPPLLLVEDNATTLRLLQRMLKGEYDVEVARGVDEALHKAEARGYDICVLDINLGERRTGIEVLHALRRIPEYKDVPILACTAYALKDHQSLFHEAGFSEVLTKPITRRNLLEGIARAIEDPTPAASSIGLSYENIELPPMPTTVTEVLDLIARNGQNESDFEELIRIVNRDQAVATWLICQANSAFFKLHAEVDSIERAIQYMGFRPVCNLFLGRLLTQQFSDFETDREACLYQYIMQQGLGAGYLARALAKHLDHPHPEIAYAAVLLSQLGRLLLLDEHREQYANLWYDEEHSFVGPPPIGQETLCLSANYVTLGAEVGRRNNFSEALLTVMRYHHRPGDVRDKECGLLTFVVATGLEIFAAMRGKRPNELLPVLLESHTLEGTAELAGVRRRELMPAIEPMLEDARAYVDEVLKEDTAQGRTTAEALS